MNERFTPNQRRAVEERGNIIVSAGAGSGKTTVMIARIIDKLLHGARLDEMLIVTFTRAAAADMRIKLAERLTKLKSEYPAIAAAALEGMAVCNIGTLHSYCQKLIKNYFYAADTDPAAVVCEEGEARLIERTAVRAAVDGALGVGDAYFAAMYDMLSSRRSDDGAVDAVESIVDFALSMPDPQGYLACVRPDADRQVELDEILQQARAELISRIAVLSPQVVTAKMTKHADALKCLAEYIDGKAEMPKKPSHRQKLDYTDVLDDEFAAIKKACTAYRASADDAQKAKTVDGTPYARALCAVAADAITRYSERKARLGKIDYSDLEHGAFRVLSNEDCMREVMRSVKYVFIDEFQDVNPLQSAIAERLREGGAEMFVVGDVKQSIYGFRRCSPAHFKTAIESGAYTHITLTDNFRSTEQVIDFINGVFDTAMTEDFGGADYRGSERLVYGNTAMTGGSAQFVLIPPPEKATAGAVDLSQAEPYSVMNNAADTSSPDPEAEFVAGSVVRWLATAQENGKKVSLGSCAVLLRSMNKEFCAALKKSFAARNVKCNFARKTLAKDCTATVALVDILRCVDNRFDDVALYTALRSPMGGFSDAELYEIARRGGAAAARNGIAPAFGTDKKSYTFWQKAGEYDGELSERLNEFFALREQISEYAKSHNCAEVLGYITSHTDYFRYVYETGGDAKAVEALIDYATERKFDVRTFLDYYDTANIDLGSSDGGDAVAVTTIHASKGLEYDYVIVANTDSKFNESDNIGRVIVTESGVAVKVPDSAEHKLVKSVPWLIENALAPRRQHEEELRLLYVALTRAKTALTVCGTGRDIKKTAPQNARRALDFLSMLAPAVNDSTPAPLLPIGDTPIAIKTTAAAEKVTAAVKARCDAEYADSDIPIKTCVTAVAAATRADDDGDDYTAAAPVLTEDDNCGGGDAKRRGIAYHKAMELVDFAAPDIDAVRDKCEDFELVDGECIVRAAQAMDTLTKNAVAVCKERYFIVDFPAVALANGDADLPEATTLVQGVIDLLILYADGTATIVDYKTGRPDHIRADAGYRKQLELYAHAVEKATFDKFRVAHAYLYAFESGELIEVEPRTGGIAV